MTKAEMLKALAEGQDPFALSIQKWKDIVNGTGTDMGPANCALCQKFSKSPNYCDGCPIEAYTGRSYCWATPYLIFVKNKDAESAKAMLSCLIDIRENIKKREEQKDEKI